ncbi:leucyl aminopeptidase [Pelagibacterium luteolum]|uniref:Probable cytosol aminopeptidase n=1 Tax=Pelagibacterium luteolum TaxID=440168 RepID=A0A1G7VVD6_9HYPH|nr:leucyl aminopeptidase [Pelagibacterium luteolum]SDG63667.1 leucyl aminopeptidase [Pelagibacterium luteolum]
MSDTLSIALTDKMPAKGAALVLYTDESGHFGARSNQLWQSTGLDFKKIAKATRFAGRPGHIVDIPAPTGIDFERLIVLGRGAEAANPEIAAWSDRGGSLFAKLDAAGVSEAAIVIDEDDSSPQMIAALAAGAKLRSYRFEKYKAKDKSDRPALTALTLHIPKMDCAQSALDRAMAVAEGTMFARDLVNEPPNHLGPADIAAIATDMSSLGLEVEILAVTDLERLGMGALLAVGQGSVRPPHVAVLHWKGGKKNDAPIAIVGKGIVFDTGGISIKGAANMDAMKGDMGGAAAVLGIMKTLALRKASINAVGVVALAENMPDGNSYRPGDILKAMSGKTIEVINTDAEGRLALADALWYTRETCKPRLMIDLATLTGAMLVAMGHDFAGLFTNTDQLADQLMSAGFATGEKVWHWPMSPAYEKLIESRFADIKNQGGRNGGAIIAAHFLANFVGDTPWAHIDIVGTAFGGPSSETNTSWASGFGVALLDRFIADNYE